ARSRGRVRIRSADPQAPLDIDHAYLSDPADLEALVDGIAIAEAITASDEMQIMLTPNIDQALPWGDPAGLPDWIVAHAGTTFHPSSTCRMGPATDPLAV